MAKHDERDTLISQPFPPHVKYAAGARLSQYVQALLEAKCPDTQQSGYTWPLRSLLNRTVRMTASMDLQHISTRAVYTRFLYDIATDAVSYRVDEDRQFNVDSVGLLRWAESVENQHLFQVVRLDAHAELHCDRWGLELTGKSPSKGTYDPAVQARGERSSAKRRSRDFPNHSVGRSPQFSSASSSSSDPREPIADVNGQSRGGASSSNFVQHLLLVSRPLPGFSPAPIQTISSVGGSPRYSRAKRYGGRSVNSSTTFWIPLNQRNATALLPICALLLELATSPLTIWMLSNTPLVMGL